MGGSNKKIKTYGTGSSERTRWIKNKTSRPTCVQNIPEATTGQGDKGQGRAGQGRAGQDKVREDRAR